MSSSNRPAKAGFTLLELLISITIFSGIIILALGAFAQSATSSGRSSLVRDKVEAARSIIDQITNDLHYVDSKNTVKSVTGCWNGNRPQFIGVRLSTTTGCDEIELLLRYPGAQATSGLVWKRYVAAITNGRASVYSYEQRDCSVVNSTINCQNGSNNVSHDLLPNRYVIDGLGGVAKVFDGKDTLVAKGALPFPVAPAITVNFSLKTQDFASRLCNTLPAGSCYTLSTTIIPGGY